MTDQEVLAQTHYWDPYFKRQAVKLLPGEYYVASDQRVLCTVLGSCVAACVRDPIARVAGMNHFLLPSNTRTTDEPSARYGIHAMELLINGLLKRGAQRRRLEVKLFGGGNLMYSQLNSNVGHTNARFALEFAHNEGLTVANQDLFGNQPRKIWYFPDTGKVLLKRLERLRNDTLLHRERDFDQRLRQQDDRSGEVELFND